MLWILFGIILLPWLLALVVFGFGSLIHVMLELRHSTKSSPAAAPADQDAVEGKALLPITLTNYGAPRRSVTYRD